MYSVHVRYRTTISRSLDADSRLAQLLATFFDVLLEAHAVLHGLVQVNQQGLAVVRNWHGLQ